MDPVDSIETQYGVSVELQPSVGVWSRSCKKKEKKSFSLEVRTPTGTSRTDILGELERGMTSLSLLSCRLRNLSSVSC